jgi:integrase
MASLVKYPGSKFFFAAFRDLRGQQHRRSTREVLRKRAQAVADQFERVAQRKGDPGRIRQVFADFYRDHYSEDLPSASVRHYAQNWLAARKAETAATTFGRYQRNIEEFLSFLGADAERDLTEITKNRIASFRDQLATRKAPSSANLDLKTIKMFFRAARLDGYVWQDPSEGVKLLKTEPTTLRRPFTIPELQSLLTVADPEWQGLIRCGLYTGQRLADIAHLRWGAVDLARHELRLVTRKTGKRLVLPLAGPLRETLLSLPLSDDPDAPLFPRAYRIVTSQKGRVSTLSNEFAELLKRAGLRERRKRNKSLGQGRGGRRREQMAQSYHSLRHTSASLLKDAGIPDAVVMALVGHSSKAMSDRYTHVGKEALSKAAAALPEL